MFEERSRSAADQLAAAEEHRGTGRLLAAETICRGLLRETPSHDGALHLLGIIAHDAGNAAVAIDLVRRAIAADATKAHYFANLGEMCRLSGRLDEAVAAGRKATAMNPDHAQAWNNLAIALYDRGEFGEAESCCRQALRVAPGLAEAYSNLGNALRAQRKLDAAVEAYGTALTLKPDSTFSYQNLGTTLREQRRFAEAETVSRKGLELRPGDTGLLNNLALSLSPQGKGEEAATVLMRSAAADSENGRTFFLLGSILLDLDRIEEARTAGEKALALLPTDLEIMRLVNRIGGRRAATDAVPPAPAGAQSSGPTTP